MPDDNRELVYCHGCKNEWFRNEHGLACPSCGSEVVEIIDPRSDPRHDGEEDSFPPHPLQDHNPWEESTPDADEAEPSTHTQPRLQDHRDGFPAPFPGVHPFDALFGNLMSGGLSGQHQQTTRNGGGWTTRISGGTLPGGVSYSYSVASSLPSPGPYNSRSMNTGQNPNEDLSGILSQLLHFMSPPTGSRFNGEANTMPSTLHPFLSLMMGGPLGGGHGDIAYTQEGFDRILTMLRDQHGGSAGPPPASAEAIAALPKIEISREQLDEQGKAECSICMDQASLGTEVTMLPCNHWFHTDCIKSWLVEHDTCPQCRRGITPRGGDQNQPRTTGQAPQYWQVSMDDLEGYVGRNSQQGTTASSSSTSNSSGATRGQESPRSPSSRSFTSMANNFIRRLSGGSNNQNSNNNNGSGGNGSLGNNPRS